MKLYIVLIATISMKSAKGPKPFGHMAPVPWAERWAPATACCLTPEAKSLPGRSKATDVYLAGTLSSAAGSVYGESTESDDVSKCPAMPTRCRIMP